MVTQNEIELAVLVVALCTIGGYDRQTLNPTID